MKTLAAKLSLGAFPPVVAQGTNGKYLELMLQGHLANELEDLLSGEMGIPRQFLTTGFSKGAKPRRAR